MSWQPTITDAAWIAPEAYGKLAATDQASS